MGLRQGAARLAAGLVSTILLAATGLVLGGAVAQALPQQGIGQAIPAQPYRGNPDATDWMGSYVVGGKQVFCIQFAFLAPEPTEDYKIGAPLKTKWGTDLAPGVPARLSYLLLRYADTKSPDEAAALAHLLHSWTAAPQTPGATAPTNDFRTIAYDEQFHFTRLTPGAQQAVAKLRADADANHGPWRMKVTKPAADQVLGTPGSWTVAVTVAETGKGVANVPVPLTVTGGKFADGTATATLRTTADGTVAVPVTPTEPNVVLAATITAPADQPRVQQASRDNVQRIVSTGGETPIPGSDTATAKNAPGKVTVAKVNEKTNAGIAGASLRLTVADKVTPAKDQNGANLLGPDGKPVVLVTGPDGTVAVPNLATPQDVCVIEVSAPPGFDKSFDPAAPPSACGTLTPGATLALTVANKPNAPNVPVAVPAGDQPVPVALGTVSRVSGPGGVLAICGLAVLLAGLGGLLVRRRVVRHRTTWR
ncbi:MAG: hypothetical protein ACJ72N_19020 [Labedaea sp.]